jgi:hypothetical protein
MKGAECRQAGDVNGYGLLAPPPDFCVPVA